MGGQSYSHAPEDSCPVAEEGEDADWSQGSLDVAEDDQQDDDSKNGEEGRLDTRKEGDAVIDLLAEGFVSWETTSWEILSTVYTARHYKVMI